MTKIGCIADDLTGATDIASVMSARGARTSLSVGIPRSSLGDSDALVIALKSRSCPPDEACEMAKSALEALRSWGADTVLFKICSTFDSTERGNIGPVGDMLADALDAKIVPVAPSYPVNKRTVYQGHLFVGDLLLSDSSMRDHPVNPMRESDLRKLLRSQSRKDVDLIDLSTISLGPIAVAERLAALAKGETAYAIVDAIEDEDLDILASAAEGLPFLIGGAALGGALANRASPGAQVATTMRLSDPSVILSGSCSAATLGQIEAARAAGLPALKLDPDTLKAETGVAEAVRFALANLGSAGVLLYSSEVADMRGGSEASEAIEQAFGMIARDLIAHDVRRLVVAGGETSGAVIQALGIDTLTLGPEIDPGVPWMQTETSLEIALKSGNFGASDFFIKAAACQ